MLNRKYRFVLAAVAAASFTSLGSFAQQATVTDAAIHELESPFRPVERNTFSTLWEATLSVTNEVTGVISSELHRYLELASGLNYQDAFGTW